LADDGSFALAYLPSPRPLTVNLSKLKGPVHAQWFDPTNEKYQEAGDGPLSNVGKREFVSPGSNAAADRDWLLVLETAHRPFSVRPTKQSSPTSGCWRSSMTIVRKPTAVYSASVMPSEPPRSFSIASIQLGSSQSPPEISVASRESPGKVPETA
jgi:hypothetical protein